MSRSIVVRRSVHPSFVAFLLLAAFGILFAGCQPPTIPEEVYTFTEEDVARYRELTASNGSGSLQEAPFLETLSSGSGGVIVAGSGGSAVAVLDMAQADVFNAVRAQSADDVHRFQVTNAFLNVRDTPSARGTFLRRLNRGDAVMLLEFVDAEWAKVRLSDGTEGFVAHRYIARVTSEERLEEERQSYEGLFVVSYRFVNLRREPRQTSEKIAEIPGGTLLRSATVADNWAAITHEGQPGYVSTAYLTPIRPQFVVRQDTFTLPVLHYQFTEKTDVTMQSLTDHVRALQQAGITLITLRELHEILLAQQSRDVRLPDRRAVIAISGITPANVKAISDALNALRIDATLFLTTRHLGLTGITEQTVRTLLANGFDVQSSTHMGDDLRALTNAQAQLELQQSRALLEQYTDRSVYSVYYPAGGTNDRIIGLAVDAGYLFGVTDGAQRTFSRSDFLRIPAFAIFPTMTTEEVVGLVKGD